MTIRTALLLLAIFGVSACAAREPLKAPCPPVAMFGASGCGAEQPINVASL